MVGSHAPSTRPAGHSTVGAAAVRRWVHGHPTLATSARVVVAVFLLLHGLVHALGVALLWRIREPGDLHYADTTPEPGSAVGWIAGAGWMLAGALLVASAVGLLLGHSYWRPFATTGAILSAVVIGLDPGQAVAGWVADAVVLLVVAFSWWLDRASDVDDRDGG